MNRRAFLRFPITALVILLVLYIAFTLFAMLDVPTWSWSALRGSMLVNRCLLLVGGCLIAGVLRVSLLHPHFAPKYANWLMSTPWHPGLQLPLGSVYLVWEDLLLVVPLGILARMDAGVSYLLPVTGYLLGYSWVAIGSVRTERGHWFALGLAFLWSLPLLKVGSIWLPAVMLVLAVIISHAALSTSLRHFPWDLGDTMRETNRRPRSGLAWPLDRVGPVAIPKPIPPGLGWAAAAVLAWWVFVVLNIFAGMFDGFLLQTVAVQIPPLCAIFCVMRLLYYCLDHWPPIGLLGRVMTGRLIIPGYDRVFIAPAACCLLAYVMPRLFAHHLPQQFSSALIVFFMTGVTLNAGPTIRSWRLTGHHRLLPMARREPMVPKTRESR